MPNNLMDQDQLKSWILRRLGAPLLKVELTEDQLDDAIETSKRWFSAKKGVKKIVPLPMFAGVSEYILPDFVDTVLDVSFPVPAMDLSLVFSPYILQDEKVPYDVFAAPSSMGLYSSYTQTIQYVEMAKRMLNAEPDWRQEGRSLFVFPIPKSNGTLLLDYKSHQITIEQLNERDHDLIKRYALAQAMLDLARVRGKYRDGFPGAQGREVLDAQERQAEAEALLEKLEVEISQSGFPLGFTKG